MRSYGDHVSLWGEFDIGDAFFGKFEGIFPL